MKMTGFVFTSLWTYREQERKAPCTPSKEIEANEERRIRNVSS